MSSCNVYMSAPDIFWIVTTQWRAQACGYAGDPNACTPALDALAADPRTVNYAQAVTPHPFGPFARAALLTGVPSPENGVRDYWDALPRGARTIAHELGARGYATAFFGKWGVGERDRAAPLVGEAAARVPVPSEARGGFSHWVGFEGGFLINDPWLHGDGVEGFSRATGYQADVLGELAAEWLRREATGPRFTVVSLETPHPPYDAPTPVGVLRIRPEEVILTANVWRGGEGEAKARRGLAGYHAHIAATGAAVGRLLARVSPETIVVVTSVHGDMHGAHGLFRKGWPHEESVRVPLLVRGAAGARGRADAAGCVLGLAGGGGGPGGGGGGGGGGGRGGGFMPSVVALPHQCDRVWCGWRSATEKAVFTADGAEWILGE